MEQKGEYKKDPDTNRTERFSSLYVIISKIGLGCVTYFMVGLVISMIYVLSDMDYFTLNGQFRNQRFFTDDGYYYTKQLVIIYGLFAFILTMFIGPVGKLFCTALSWVLSFCYINIFFLMCTLSYIKQFSFLMNCIPLISFLSHSLLCNIIFTIFDPNLSSINNIPELNKSIKVSKTNVNYTFYQMVSFISGYFLGFSSLSLIFKNFVSFSKNEIIDKNIYLSFNILNVMSIILSISIFTTILLTFNFLYNFYESYRYIKSVDFKSIIINIRYFYKFLDLLLKDLTWFPFLKLSRNILSKIVSNVLYFELVFMWFLNPMNVSAIPYTIGTHFQFQKLSHINKMLFSLTFVIMVLIINQDIIYNCISLITDLNIEIFNIMYTHSYFQIKDDHLRETCISTTTQTNYVYSFHDDKRNNKNFNCTDSQKYAFKIGLPSIAWYSHSSIYYGDVENEDKNIVSFINQMSTISQSLEYHIKSGNESDMNSIIEHVSLLSNKKIWNDDISTSSLYMQSQFRDQLMSIISNAICDYDLDKTFQSISKLCFKLIYDLNITHVTVCSSFLLIYTLIIHISICLGCICVDSFFKSSFQSIICDLTKSDNLIREHQTDVFSLDKELSAGSNFKTISESARHHHNIILNVLSHMSVIELRQILLYYFRYSRKTINILLILNKTSRCCCICCFDNSCEVGNCFFYLKLLLSSKVYPNQYKVFFLRSLLENRLNHFCLCLIVQYQLIPALNWSLYYLTDFINEFFSTYKREFNRYIHPTKYKIDLTRTLLLVVDVVEKITEFIEKNYLCSCPILCSCRLGKPCNSCCRACLGKISKTCCICTSRSNNCICCCCPRRGGCTRCSLCLGGKCCCCCICFCKFEEDSNYFYFSSIIMYICSLMEYLFKLENHDIKNCMEYLSKLKSELDLIKFNSKNNGISLFSMSTISVNYLVSISNNKIALGLEIFHGSTELFSSGIIGLSHITQHVLSIAIINNSVFNPFFQFFSIMSFYMINSTQISAPAKCEIKNFMGFLSINYIVRITCLGQQRCSCPRGDLSKCILKMNCFILVRKYFELVSLSISNFFMSSLLDASIIGELWPIPSTKNIFEKNTNLLSCIISLSRNTIINNSLCCDTLENRNTFKNELEIKLKENYSRSGGNRYFNNRMITILIILIISMLFGSINVKPDLDSIAVNSYESDEKYTPLDTINEQTNLLKTDIEKKASLYLNNVQNKGVNNSKYIKQKTKKFNLKVLSLSVISPIYTNMLMKAFYTKLDLDYSLWSYMVNFVLMSGMIFSLFSKQFIQIYSYFNVLDNYGSYLSKDDSLIYNMLDEDQQDVIKNTRPMMVYNMFKTSNLDLLSLLNIKNPSEHVTTFNNFKNKLYPYKEMTKPIHKIVKKCDQDSHSFCKIQDEVLDGIGVPGQYVDIISALDFLSYSMITNNKLFNDQYKSYFSGDENYMAWVLGKEVNNNTFLAEYYRHSSLNKIESEIKKLSSINKHNTVKNLMLIWNIFSRSEIDLISVKSITDNMEVQMIQDQRNTLKKLYYEQYLKDFNNFQKYVCSKMFNDKVVGRHKPTAINSAFEFISVLDKTILDKNKLDELSRNYFNDEYDKTFKSMSIPTITCDITGDKKDVKKRVNEFCEDWLENKLHFCKHMNNIECQKAVNVAYNTIVDLVEKPGDLYKNIYELLDKIDLDNSSILKESNDNKPTLGYLCKDCESLSMYYISQHLTYSYTNVDRMLRPLGMYLSCKGTHIDKQRLHKCSHTH